MLVIDTIDASFSHSCKGSAVVCSRVCYDGLSLLSIVSIVSIFFPLAQTLPVPPPPPSPSPSPPTAPHNLLATGLPSTCRRGRTSARETLTVLMVTIGKRRQKDERKEDDQQGKEDDLHHLQSVIFFFFFKIILKLDFLQNWLLG